MDWLNAALFFTGLSSAIVAGCFLYVWWGLIRRRYVLLWSLAWTAALPHLVFTWLRIAHPGSHPIWAAWQLALVANVLLMVGGCFEFVNGKLPARRLAFAALPLVAWAAVAPLLTDRFFDITVVNSVLLACSYLWAATLFLRLRRERATRGAGLVALLFALAGFHELDYPLFGDVPWAAVVGYTLAATFALAIAFCLLIMVLEESRSDAERERARMRAILENLPVGVVMVATDGKIQLANDVARGLLPGALVPGRDLKSFELEVFRRADGGPCPSRQLPISAALDAGQISAGREFAVPSADGSSRPFLVNAGPVHDDKGNLGAVAVFQEISDLKKMQSEVIRAQRLQGLGTLAAGVAHDFNNALTLILGHAELAGAHSSEPDVRRQLQVICQVATDSAAIVRRIQDVARTRTTRDAVSLDLAAIARQVIEIARPRWRDEAQARGLRYDVRYDGDTPVPIAGHPAELREALLNLFFNALDAMPEGGTLRLAVGAEKGEARLRVTDSGSGMTADVRDRIFDPFFTTKGQRGNGLGLALVFGIVQRHEGRIAVDSTPGLGSTFTLTFPLAAAAPRESGHGIVPAPLACRRVLVVDDEPLVRTMMAAMLKSAGHEVTAAVDGQTAVELARETAFDTVVTDLGMPGMNGWEVAAAIREIRPQARIVLATGWGDSVTNEQAAQSGVSKVLSKPFTRVQLLASVAESTPVPALATAAMS